MSPKISVIVPYIGRDKVFTGCLESLMGQTIEITEYEIIIVCDGTCLPEATRRRLANNCVVYSKPHTGVCGARNYGAARARAPLIVFLDDDCCASCDLLQNFVRFFNEHPFVDAASGTVLGSSKARGMVANYATIRKLLCYPVRYMGQIQTVITANCCLRREVFNSVGGFDCVFDEYFSSCGGEDADLSFMLRAAGIELSYCEEAVAYHYHRDSLRGFIGQQVRNGEGLMVHSLYRKVDPRVFGLPIRPSLRGNLCSLVRFIFVSSPERDSESLLKRAISYRRSGIRWYFVIPFLLCDLLRRICYLHGGYRAHHNFRWRMTSESGSSDL